MNFERACGYASVSKYSAIDMRLEGSVVRRQRDLVTSPLFGARVARPIKRKNLDLLKPSVAPLRSTTKGRPTKGIELLSKRILLDRTVRARAHDEGSS